MQTLNRQIVFTNSTITVDGASVGASYDIPLGDPAQYTNELIGFFTISGGPLTLNTSLVITSSYTPQAPVDLTSIIPILAVHVVPSYHASKTNGLEA